MRRWPAAVGVTLTLMSAAATAQPRPELDGPAQADMNQQAAARYRVADEQLNAIYGKLMASASADGRNRLQAAQRAWIGFRDLDCDARAGSRGGSFYAASYALCLEQLTDERTRTLRGELECEEGDLTCGGVRWRPSSIPLNR